MRSRCPAQEPLLLEPPPPLPAPGASELDERLRLEAEAFRLSRSYWRQRFRTLDEVLADPVRGRMFLICARNACIARQRQAQI